MLISAIIALLVLIGGTADGHWGYTTMLDDVDNLVSKNVKDGDRRKQAEAVVDQMQADLMVFRNSVFANQQAFIAVDARYDATPDDYRAAFDQLYAAWDVNEKEVLDQHLELKSHLTKEEWSKVFDGLRGERR